MRSLKVGCVVAAALLVAASLGAQDSLKVDVRLVNIVATVMDSNGRYVANLKASDFAVDEDGRRQTVVHFSQDNDVPVSVGIVLDTSGSMDAKIKTASDAVKRFIRSIHEDDDIFLMTFSGEPKLETDFTSNRQKLSKALDKVRLRGGTALYDALDEALDKIKSGEHDKKAILLITDGLDTSSFTTDREVAQRIRKSHVLVYCLGIGEENPEPSPFAFGFPQRSGPFGRGGYGRQRDAVNMMVLRRFADNSGGRAVLLSERAAGSQLDRVLTQIADELRSQYTLGYYPATPDDGRFHNIRVVTRYGYTVRTRTGYLAGSN
jgi:Ca-activated chloride channel homolog